MRAGKKEIVLSWEQRLQIAIDAAQGSLINFFFISTQGSLINEHMNLKKFLLAVWFFFLLFFPELIELEFEL